MILRTIGIQEIEDIAMGAALLGAGGGGDPYVGKLVAMDAVQACGPVTLLDPDEVADDALVIPIAMMGAPTVLGEKAIGGQEYQTLYDMVSQYFGKKIDAFMPIEAGGVNSMLPIAASARLGIPLVDVDGMGRAFPELQMVTFTIGGISATPMALTDEKGNSVIFNTITNKWTEELARAVTMSCGGSVSVSLYPMSGAQMKQYGVKGIVTRSQRLGEAIRTVKDCADQSPEERFLSFTGATSSSRARSPTSCGRPAAPSTSARWCWRASARTRAATPLWSSRTKTSPPRSTARSAPRRRTSFAWWTWRPSRPSPPTR